MQIYFLCQYRQSAKGPGDLEERMMASLKGGQEVAQHRWARRAFGQKSQHGSLRKEVRKENTVKEDVSSDSQHCSSSRVSSAVFHGLLTMEQEHLQCAAPKASTYTEGPIVGPWQSVTLWKSYVQCSFLISFALYSDTPHFKMAFRGTQDIMHARQVLYH